MQICLIRNGSTSKGQKIKVEIEKQRERVKKGNMSKVFKNEKETDIILMMS